MGRYTNEADVCSWIVLAADVDERSFASRTNCYLMETNPASVQSSCGTALSISPKPLRDLI